MNKKQLLFLLILFILGFGLNFLWENLHFGLYASNTIGISENWLLWYASFVDAIIILGVYLILSLLNKKVIWKFSKKNLILFSGLLVVVAILIELRAIITGRWIYGTSMPTIFRIGLSPLIQLAITGLVDLAFLKQLVSLLE